MRILPRARQHMQYCPLMTPHGVQYPWHLLAMVSLILSTPHLQTTVRGAGAPIITHGEEEETKAWMNVALLLQDSAATTLLTGSQLLPGSVRSSDPCFSSATGASSNAEHVHTFALFFLFILVWVFQLFSLLGGHIQTFFSGVFGPVAPRSCAGWDCEELEFRDPGSALI